MSDYEAQAAKFLNDFGLTFKAAWKSNEPSPYWADDHKGIHGDQYRITVKRRGGKSISFDFWNSYNAKREGKPPTAYDVLACMGSDFFCPETFEEFCLEYGYDADSRRAERMFNAADKFARKLRAFFSEREAERLSEIQ